MPNRAEEPRLRVAIEATSLLGARTGIGAMTAAVLRRLAEADEFDLTGLLISWRGRRRIAAELPPGVEAAAVSFPARLAHRLWRRFDRPSVSGFDVVHGPNFVVPPSPGAVEIVTVHDFGPWHFPELVTEHARAYPALIERAVSRGAHVHVVSEFVGSEARSLLGLADERIHVIPNGFDPGPAGDAEAGRSIAGGRYVLSLGTIEPRKDLPTLVAAMARVWRAEPDLRLVVAGADGWGTEAFDDAVAKAGAGDRLVRLGYVTDVQRADLLAGAACLAFPSLYEGFGLPPLEAMAQDCPVVTTTAGALPDTCGPAARYVEPGDDEQLAAAIEAVVSEPDVAAELVAAGRARHAGYSWDATTSELAALYRHLAATRS